MYDKDLVKEILIQISDALDKISTRIVDIKHASYFTDSPMGMEKLDGICMLFIAIGESLKNIDKISNGTLLIHYPEIDWAGVKGFRDIIVHHYFDVDAEQVFWICSHELVPLAETIRKMLRSF